MINTPIENLLFIDIETVSQHAGYSQLTNRWKELWTAKIERQLTEDDTPEAFYEKRAAIMAEFGKIICISSGYLLNDGGKWQLRVKSFFSDDERDLLTQVIKAFHQWQAGRKQAFFCGHNIREFDIPYLCRRLLINNLPVPPYLDFQSMKPWESNLLDTFHLWKFGDFKNYTSLNLLAACMDIPSPKEDMDGSMVGRVYWEEHDLPKIASYCARDVVTVAQLILRFKQRPLLNPDEIVIVT